MGEQQAQKNAVKAMERAFAKKKEEQRRKEADADVESINENQPVIPPVPVTRTSIKKKKEVSSGSGYEKPVLRIVDFGQSGTNYSNIVKKIH